ncbi:leucine rich repeat family protein, partial [Cystoisospora suis]
MGEKTWSESVPKPWIKSNYGLRFSPAASLGHGAPSVAKGLSIASQHRVSSKLCQLKQRDGICPLTKEEIQKIWKQAARIQPVEMAHIDSLSSFMNQCTKHLEMLPGTLQEKAVSKASTKKEASHLHGVSRLAETATAKKYSCNPFLVSTLSSLQARPCSDDGASTNDDGAASDVSEDECLPNECYDDKNLAFLMQDLRTVHNREYYFTEKSDAATKRLQKVTGLNLSDHNWITPQVLTELLASCPNISTLKLARCQVDESLASVIGSCYKISTLDLSHTKELSSLVFLQNLEALKVLRLSGCRTAVTDPMVGCITSSPGLEVLHLSGCSQLTNEGLYVLGRYLENLREVDFSDC